MEMTISIKMDEKKMKALHKRVEKGEMMEEPKEEGKNKAKKGIDKVA